MSVKFELWGEHDFYKRLSLEEHAGRHRFWFDKEMLSDNFLLSRLDSAIANAGARYTPELNVELEISKTFEWIAKTDAFRREITRFSNNTKHEFGRCAMPVEASSLQVQFDNMSRLHHSLIELLTAISPIASQRIPSEEILRLAKECIRKAEELRERVVGIEIKEERPRPTDGSYRSSPKERLDWFHRDLGKLEQAIAEIDNFFGGLPGSVCNRPYLLVVGNAMTGKTHLACDIAKSRIARQLPTLLYLGEQFGEGEPWSQMIRLAGLRDISVDEFLGACNAAGQARESRILIIIDAINEGNGLLVWKKFLGGMLTQLERYPYVGLVLTVRTSYREAVVPDHLDKGNLSQIEHHGFRGKEYDATKKFFAHYSLEFPSTPLLEPEFSNPGFLKILCKSLQTKGLTRIPDGLDGTTALFEFLLNVLNEKFSSIELLDYNKKDNKVKKVVKLLAEQMIETGTEWIDQEKASPLVETICRSSGYEQSMLRQLVSEGVLSEDIFPNESGTGYRPVIRFAYQRLAHHQMAESFLERYVKPKKLSGSFTKRSRLGKLVSEFRFNSGLIDALSIHVPEKFGKELIEVVPYIRDRQSTKRAFIESLIWRNPSTIGDAALQYINSHLINDHWCRQELFNAFLTVAPKPAHPFNALRLHGFLKKFDMARRDALWSAYLQSVFRDNSSLDRLIDWSIDSHDKKHISDHSIDLTATSLAWFLTSSNRYLRDTATKALVVLLTPRPHLLEGLFLRFKDVNDLYVVERVLAVVYGCLMRNSDLRYLKRIAQTVYGSIFSKGRPLTHVLVRDYARGIIELALSKGLTIAGDMAKVRPPYKSKWRMKVWSDKKIKNDSEWEGYWSIHHSVLYNFHQMPGDFGKYIINPTLDDFGNQRLGSRRRISKRERYENFIAGLSKTQKKEWDNLQQERFLLSIPLLDKLMEGTSTPRLKTESISPKEDNKPNTEQIFIKKLSSSQKNVYSRFVRSFQDYSDRLENSFGTSLAQKWIFQRVIEMGWTPELFKEFERYSAGGYDRGPHKAERVGKKYQWIALHELLALVSDNFVYFDDRFSGKLGRFEGPWQIYRRDIDPSYVQVSYRSPGEKTHPWWIGVKRDEWADGTHEQWMASSADIPTPERLISVSNPSDGSRWFLMEAMIDWDEPIEPGQDRYSIPRRQIWYMLKSYFVRKRDVNRLYTWAIKQRFMGRWMPESHYPTDVFLGEFFWAPSFMYYDKPTRSRRDWIEGEDSRIPMPILITTDQYFQETGYDCSLEESAQVMLPAKQIVESMRLTWNGTEGHWFDSAGHLVAYDPAVHHDGPHCLLFEQSRLRKFLNDNNLDILWTVLGEKRMIGGNGRGNSAGFSEISGAYSLTRTAIKGKINFKHYKKRQ